MRACSATIPACERERRTCSDQGTFTLIHTVGGIDSSQVIMIHMRNVQSETLTKQLVRKMAPPLVTLLSNPPEVQWVALRNINLLLQKRPDILSNEMRVFFCKYNDPIYVKLAKLEIMYRLSREDNYRAVLTELQEYVPGRLHVEQLCRS